MLSIDVMFALDACSFICPKYRTYATSVSGWLDMYMHRKEDLAATGSSLVDMMGVQVSGNDVVADAREIKLELLSL